MNGTNTADVCIYHDNPYRDIKLFNFYLTVIVSVFGLISNTVVIIVNRTIKSPTSTDVFITFLAVTDNTLIVVLSLLGHRYVYPFLAPPERVEWLKIGVVSVIAIVPKIFAQCLNVYTIVLLNVDRWLQVKFFLRAKKWCTPRRAIIQLSIAAVGSLAFVIPKIIEIIPAFDNKEEAINSCTGFFRLRHGLAADPTFELSYRLVLHMGVLYVIPLTILMFTNISLICALRQHRKWLMTQPKSRYSAGGSSNDSGEKEPRGGMKRKDASIVITLLAVTIVFMVCQIPDLVQQFVWRLDPKHGPTASIFGYQIFILNSSINFIIYAVSSSPFRKRLRKVFSACCRRSESLSGELDEEKDDHFETGVTVV